MTEKKQNQQKQDSAVSESSVKRESSFLAKTIVIGFVGGILWSFIGYLTYVFNFSEIHPNTILQPWALGAWKERWIGLVVSIFVIGILSMIVGLLYYVLLKKFKTMWVGIGYGLLLWAVVFLVLNPLFPTIKTVADLTFNTIITTICLYILYGVFVGYSISFEAAELYTNDQSSDSQTMNK
ncbi:hypothetical protein FZC66_02295 [Priestia megaterium]|nr:hypothetical protein FZC66_02295 [Priestia megaterium]